LANINDFWELVKVAGGGTSTSLTRVLDSIVKSDAAKVNTFFTNVIDQLAFNTQDWKRLRQFFISIYAAHRSIATQASQISDPSNLSNDELDELFRSFGYPESTILRAFDNNPLPTKIALFLSLVDLYKIKGTPRSILEVLQFYGISELDIYEFWLQKQDPQSLIFKGDAVTGTTLNPDTIFLSYDLLTGGDPHWLLTENQILQLDSINDINLPSKSPYFAIVPIIEFGSETGTFIRIVQDQYEEYKNTGVLPPQNAEIRILGETVSFLELYLSCVYEFQKLWTVGYKGDRFICYDGDSTSPTIISQEYNDILSAPITRSNIPIKLLQYYDKFSRETPRQFLQNKNDAETILNQINPTLKTEIDNLTDSVEDVLQSLLKDLGIWVRNNLGLGFVNAGYITFGLNNLFDDLKGVINFFKPYRARLILLERLVFNQRLFDSIRLDDKFEASPSISFEFSDYLTADSKPCCSGEFEVDSSSAQCYKVGETLPACTREYTEKICPDSTTCVNMTGLWTLGTSYSVNDGVLGTDGIHDYKCIVTHTSTNSTKPGYGVGWMTYWEVISQFVCIDTTGNTFYTRDTFDCGSYFDIGAVSDIAHPTHHPEQADLFPSDVHMVIGQDFYDRLRCYHCTDSTGCVDIGCSDCINDGYCRFLGYDCLRTPIDSDGYVTSETISGNPPDFIDDTSVTYVFDSTSFLYYQSGGFADWDKGGMFDCTHGFDLVQITIEEVTPAILKEDGDFLLQENGGKLLVEDMTPV
jgi:hypothetical protein